MSVATEHFIGTRAAARILGVNRNRVYEFVQDGKLSGERSEGTGRPLRFDPDEVEDFRVAREERHRSNGQRERFRPMAVRLPDNPIAAVRKILSHISGLSPAAQNAQIKHARADLVAVQRAALKLPEARLRDYIALRLLTDLSEAGYLTTRVPRFLP